MSKLIEDTILNTSIIFANNRTSRPHITNKDDQHLCPFCLGNEYLLENIWLENKIDADECIKVINNKYPFCRQDDGLYGFHDVVIDTVDHNKNPKDFLKKHWYGLLKTMQQRWKQLSENERIGFIQIFKNHGTKAGASIAHSHWQIVALENPPYTKHSEQLAMDYSKNDCRICSVFSKSDHSNVIEENNFFVAVAPQMSIFPHETWLVPKRHCKHYGLLSDEELKALGNLFRRILLMYENIIPDISYNICFMSGSLKEEKDYHFFVKILPRTGNLAGFELATGCYINVVEPLEHKRKMQEAAKKLDTSCSEEET